MGAKRNFLDGRQHVLKRLDPANYKAQAYVHWSMTIENRKTGWLTPEFYFKFRELLTHAAFRYGLCSPIFTCMPDHIHLLLVGILDDCDQRKAIKFLRTQLKPVLEKRGAKFQQQPYDHVLGEEERERSVFETVVEYLARNPERAGLVALDQFREYQYSSCLVPGYPDLSPFQNDFWDKFWRIYSKLRRSGMNGVVGATNSEM